MEEKKSRASRSEYITDYIKKHYKRKELKLKPSEAEKVEAVLIHKKTDLKSYLLGYINKDFLKIKNVKK